MRLRLVLLTTIGLLTIISTKAAGIDEKSVPFFFAEKSVSIMKGVDFMDLIIFVLLVMILWNVIKLLKAMTEDIKKRK